MGFSCKDLNHTLGDDVYTNPWGLAIPLTLAENVFHENVNVGWIAVVVFHGDLHKS